MAADPTENYDYEKHRFLKELTEFILFLAWVGLVLKLIGG